MKFFLIVNIQHSFALKFKPEITKPEITTKMPLSEKFNIKRCGFEEGFQERLKKYYEDIQEKDESILVNKKCLTELETYESDLKGLVSFLHILEIQN